VPQQPQEAFAIIVKSPILGDKPAFVFYRPGCFIVYIAMLQIKEERVTLLFTEKEWNDAMPDLTKSMTDYLRPYRTGVFEHFTNDGDEWGEGWGNGSYLRVGDTVHVLTNEHVSSVIRDGRKLAYQFDGQDDIRPFAGIYAEFSAPFDLRHLRYVQYLNNAEGRQVLGQTLERRLEAIIEG
jgi:hypothetical protein